MKAAALGAVLAALIVSGIQPYDRATWWMEVAPVLIAAPLLVITHRRYPLTPLLYALIFVHALVLILGGAYTYARVPLGFWLQDLLALERNPYDRIGHFMQGFVPAMVAREILLRGRFVAGAKDGWISVRVRGARRQRGLRADRVGRGARAGAGGGGVPRHAGRSVGHAGRHVLALIRRRERAASRYRACTTVSSRAGRRRSASIA